MPALPQRDTAANLELIPAVVMLLRREIWRIEGGMRVGRVETLGGSTGRRKAGRLKIHPSPRLTPSLCGQCLAAGNMGHSGNMAHSGRTGGADSSLGSALHTC